MAEKLWVLCAGMRCQIWRNSLDFVDIRSRYLFSKTSIYCKIKTIAFLFAFFFCFALFIVHPELYWLWIKVSITVTPHEHHGVSEQRQLLIKGQNSALLTHCEGGDSSHQWVTPKRVPRGIIIAEKFACYAGESVWNQGRISNTMYRNLCWIP